MTTTEQMKEELLKAKESIDFAVDEIKEAHRKAIECNPFAEFVLYDLIKQIRDIQFTLSQINHMVERTDVTIK
jgi:hypothetical protein